MLGWVILLMQLSHVEVGCYQSPVEYMGGCIMQSEVGEMQMAKSNEIKYVG